MLSPDSLLSLREILRVRHELPADEVARLLDSLPAILDTEDNGSASALINEVFVVFDTPPAGGVPALAKTPVTAWPPFKLHVDAEAEQDAGATIVGGISLYATAPVARLAALLYELLGGRIRNEELLRGRYSPLGEIDETANQVLRKALSPRGYPDCRAFWKEWVKLVAPELAAAPAPPAPPKQRTFRIPPALLGVSQLASLLELTPLDKPAVPTRFVARSIFRIGRSRRLSDLPTRSSNDSGAGEAIRELSRVHAIVQRTGAGLSFRDGNGEKPSSNGSLWNGTALTHTSPTPITGPGMLLLSPTSCRFRLEVLPVAESALSRLGIENLAEWTGADTTLAQQPAAYAALTFRHPRGAMVVRQSVFLLSAIGAEIKPSGELTWHDEAEEPPLIILHRAGAFWIANAATEGEMRLDDIPLAQGEIAPLSDGRTLTVDGVSLRLTVA